jgi:hypothetical protein
VVKPEELAECEKMTNSIFSNQFELSLVDKAAIIRAWWPGVEQVRLDDYQTYFDFLHQELKNIPWRNASPGSGVQTLEDLLKVVQILSKASRPSAVGRYQEAPRLFGS